MIPAPGNTTPPLPTVSPQVETFISELTTAILYAELVSNDGFDEKLCSVINPSGLDGIEGVNAVNGTAVQNEVCAVAQIDAADACLAATVQKENQIVVQYLFQALFAVQ